MSKKGPKQKTIKDKHGNRLVFHVKDKKLKLKVIRNINPLFIMSLTDAQVRGLRNWLNWYLDNK